MVLALGLVFALTSCTGADPATLRARASAELQAGQAKVAAETLDSLATLGKPTPADRLLRGQVARALGQTDQALSELAEVPDDDPNAAEARLIEGQIQVRSGKLRLAELAFLRALAKDSNLVQARRELIYIYGMQLRRKELGEQFRVLSKLGPLTSQQVWLWSMSADLIWWEPKENEKQLLEFVENDPEDRWTRLALAENYRRLGWVSKCRELLSVLPEDDIEASALRALTAVEAGEIEEAEALMNGSQRDHPALARLRGRIAIARRDAPAALAELKAAYEAEPWRRDATSALGGAYQLAGDLETAKRYLDDAKRLDVLAGLLAKVQSPLGIKDPTVFRELGAACEAVGRPDEARAWYRLAITKNPLDSAAQLALHRLETTAKSTP